MTTLDRDPLMTPCDPMPPRRVLYVYSGKARPGGAGLDLVVRQELQALAEAGHRVVFLARGSFRHPRVRNLTLPITPANALSFLSSKHYYNAQNRFFSQLGAWLVARGEWDAVIGWTRQSRNLFRAAAARRIPALLNCPGWHYNYPLGEAPWEVRPWPSFQKGDLDEEFTRADGLLVTSEQAAVTFRANGLPDARIHVIGRGADPGRFQYRQRPPELPFRAVFYGRVNERKGIFQLLEAWRQAAIPGGELWIIGSIPREVEGELMARLPPGAKLFGHRDDGESLLVQCHVQLLLSRREGMAKSLVEGAACGLITLATPESGFPIREGVTGYTVDRDDIAGVADRLRELAADAPRRQRMAEAAAALVREELTWERFRARFLAAFHQRLAGV